MASESIYTWIKPDPVAPQKQPLYHSRASHDAPLVGSTIVIKKGSHTGMGMTRKQMKETIKPENFLRAHQNTGWVDTSALRMYCEQSAGRSVPFSSGATNPFAAAPHHKSISNVPAVPRRNERPSLKPREDKDFVTLNAINAITMKARVQRKGDPVALLADPEAKAKVSYGRVPAYLAKVKEEIEAEREYILHLLDQEQLAAEAAVGSSTRELSEDERGELIDALKTKWDEVNEKYQVRSILWSVCKRFFTPFTAASCSL